MEHFFSVACLVIVCVSPSLAASVASHSSSSVSSTGEMNVSSQFETSGGKYKSYNCFTECDAPGLKKVLGKDLCCPEGASVSSNTARLNGELVAVCKCLETEGSSGSLRLPGNGTSEIDSNRPFRMSRNRPSRFGRNRPSRFGRNRHPRFQNNRRSRFGGPSRSTWRHRGRD